MPIDEVEHLVEQHQDRAAGHLDQSTDRLGTWRDGARGRSEHGNPRVTGELVSEVDPGGFPPFPWVPGVADEDGDLGPRHRRQSRFEEERGDAVEAGRALVMPREMIKRGERMGLAPAKLGDQGQDRGGVLGTPGQSSQDHPGVVAEGAGEAGPREELRGIDVILRRGPGDDLLEGDGKLVGVEGSAEADLRPRTDGFVPGLHQVILRGDDIVTEGAERANREEVTALVGQKKAHPRELQKVVVNRFELVRQRVDPRDREAEVRIEFVGDAEGVGLEPEEKKSAIPPVGARRILDPERRQVSRAQSDSAKLLRGETNEADDPPINVVPSDRLDTHRLAEDRALQNLALAQRDRDGHRSVTPGEPE